MKISWTAVAEVVIGMVIFTLVAKMVLSKIPLFNYEDDSYEEG